MGRVVTARASSLRAKVWMAYFDDTAGTFSAGDLADVTIASAFTMPTS
jgi:hypothetical protein